MTNEEVKKKLQWLCERILRCMDLRCPEAKANVWSTRSKDPLPRVAFFTEWGFRFSYDNSHSITVKNMGAGPGNALVLHYDLDSGEFYWNQAVVEEYVEEIVNRILVLETLAEIEE